VLTKKEASYIIVLGIVISVLPISSTTINVKPETPNQILELTGLAKPRENCGLLDTGPGLARQESAGQGFGWVANKTDLCLQSKREPLAGVRGVSIT